MTIKQRYERALAVFEQQMPNAATELEYTTPYELLVAVILSAQCTDKRVNMVTPDLFKAFPTVEALAEGDRDEIFEHIKSVSFPANKTKSLMGMARMVVDEFGGRVPDNMDDLLRLPGVGRKTANVILSVVYDRPAMAVDTHVFRVAERIGLTTGARTPLDTEMTLMRHIPTDKVGKAHHWLILHGRYVCKARRPECERCPITDVCRHYTKQQPAKK